MIPVIVGDDDWDWNYLEYMDQEYPLCDLDCVLCYPED
jgi:hypothetical protein